jgi:hypothetical protein
LGAIIGRQTATRSPLERLIYELHQVSSDTERCMTPIRILVRIEGVRGSNPLSSTERSSRFGGAYFHVCLRHSGVQAGVGVLAVLSRALGVFSVACCAPGVVPGMPQPAVRRG